MPKKWMLSVLAILSLIVAVLVLQNPSHPRWSKIELVWEAYPFLTGAIAGTLCLAFMVLTANPPITSKAWQPWKFFDPLEWVVFTYILTTTGYFWLVWARLTRRYEVPDDLFTVLRIMLFLGSFFGIPIIAWLLWNAWREATPARRIKYSRIYGGSLTAGAMVGISFARSPSPIIFILLFLAVAHMAITYFRERGKIKHYDKSISS